MSKSLEGSLDFSKLEDQQKFSQLSEEEKTNIVIEGREDAEEIQNTFGNDTNEFIDQCEKSPEFAKDFYDLLRKINKLEEQRNNVWKDIGEAEKKYRELRKQVSIFANEDFLKETLTKQKNNNERLQISGDAYPYSAHHNDRLYSYHREKDPAFLVVQNLALEQADNAMREANCFDDYQKVKEDLKNSLLQRKNAYNEKEGIRNNSDQYKDEEYGNKIDECEKNIDLHNEDVHKKYSELADFLNKKNLPDDELRIILASTLFNVPLAGSASRMGSSAEIIKKMDLDSFLTKRYYSDGDSGFVFSPSTEDTNAYGYGKKDVDTMFNVFENLIQKYVGVPDIMKVSDEDKIAIENEINSLKEKINKLNSDDNNLYDSKRKIEQEGAQSLRIVKNLLKEGEKYESAEDKLKKNIFTNESKIAVEHAFATRSSDSHFDTHRVSESKIFENNQDFIAHLLVRTYEDYGAGESDYNFIVITDKDKKILGNKIGYTKFLNSEATSAFSFQNGSEEYKEIISAEIKKDDASKDAYTLKVLCKNGNTKEFSGKLE